MEPFHSARFSLARPLVLGLAWPLVLGLWGCSSPCPAGPTASCGAASGERRGPFLPADLPTVLRIIEQPEDFAGPVGNLDILFLIDNSPGMSAKQKALAQNIPLFLQKLDAIPANYHIGIANSDVGSWTAPGTPWPSPLGTCNSYEGQDGALQRDPCTSRTGVTMEAMSACQQLCPDSSFVPNDGHSFISKINGITNVPKKIMGGVDIGPQLAFQCLAMQGDNGCGIESQIEGAKRALDGHNPLNSGFLRVNSVLALVILTDEDDCSVQLSRRNENTPVTMDCPTGDKNAAFSCFNPDYRCIARDVSCNEPLNTTGLKTNCQERSDSYLEPVANYVRFFQSLRPPAKLLVSGIWAVPDLTRGSKFLVSYPFAGMKSYDLNRAVGMDAACFYAKDPNVYARPQLRLSRFASQFKGSTEVSICDLDNYAQALDSIAKAVQVKLQVNCLDGVPRKQGDRPVCLVGDVDAQNPDNAPDVAFPVCSAGCCAAFASSSSPTASDPAVKAACAGETTDACYCAVPSAAGLCPGGAVAGLWRKGAAPPNKVVNMRCAVQ